MFHLHRHSGASSSSFRGIVIVIPGHLHRHSGARYCMKKGAAETAPFCRHPGRTRKRAIRDRLQSIANGPGYSLREFRDDDTKP
jgi:hypothetical protein